MNSCAFFALIAGVAIAAGAPAGAQTVEELTVTGRYGADDSVRSLSRAVSYSDLDLTTRAGAELLKVRISETAKSLCAELGESGGRVGVAPSCQAAATSDAMRQARTAIAVAVPRTLPAEAMGPSSAETYGAAASSVELAPPPAPPPAPTYTTSTVTNGPVADTPENRAAYGQPMSATGRMTAPAGN